MTLTRKPLPALMLVCPPLLSALCVMLAMCVEVPAVLWMPAELALGIAVGIRHDDWNTRQQRTWTAGNVEIGAYTELVNQTRADARMLLQRRIHAVGADGAVIATMGLSTWEIEPGEGHTDHIAEATITATAITQFHRSRVAPSRSLTYLPLKRSRP